MSLVYLVNKNPASPSGFGSTFTLDFDADSHGEFAVLAFRVPAKVLTQLVQRSSRYIQIESDEVRAVLKAIIANTNEPEDVRSKAKEILEGR